MKITIKKGEIILKWKPVALNKVALNIYSDSM